MIKAETNKCVECASINLKGRWGLTSFAQTYHDYSFTATCALGTDREHYTKCSGYCMTYLFQDPDATDTSDNELMVVRGCHQRLLGIQSTSIFSNQTLNGSYCEYDKDLERFDSQGNKVYLKALVEFCTGEVCNAKVKDFSMSTTCIGNANLINNSDRMCYSCNTMEKNCMHNEELCNKKFCSKSIVKFDDLYVVHKSCTDINPLGNKDGCTSSNITTIPGNMFKLNGEIIQCFCSDKDYCNGVNKIVLSAICLILLLFQFI
ncbi:LexA repressor [Dirofilaria immitis]